MKLIKLELRGHGITVARTGRLAKRAAAIGLPKLQHHTETSAAWITSQSIADGIEAAAQGAPPRAPLRAPRRHPAASPVLLAGPAVRACARVTPEAGNPPGG
ncbi:hypothetical protein AB0H73_09770 [Streptomyces olivoreticuli]